MRPLLIVAALAAGIAAAQQPRIENARLETRALSGPLDATLQNFIGAQAAPAWIGYAVPMLPGDRQVCGWDGSHGQSNHLSLEGPTTLFILYRAEQKELSKVRLATPDCEIDAGGAPVTWLTGVSADQSVAYLSSLVTGSKDRLGDSAVSAIAMHAGPAAERALDGLVSPNQSESVRRKAVFWLGTTRGRHGYEKVLDVIKNDPSDKVREHAIFALSQSKEKDAIPTIVKIAREDHSTRVRSQALFWLAQSAQKKLAADTLMQAVENDPETEVKKKAVFGLSQLPNGEGVTKLIEVAKTNRNPAVRKQALFWLGQSHDPRALQFFEEILTR
jgi:hypothetical protein